MVSRLIRFCLAGALALTPVAATLLFTPDASASKFTGWPFGSEYKNRQKKKDDNKTPAPATPNAEAAAPAPTTLNANDAIPVNRSNDELNGAKNLKDAK